LRPVKWRMHLVLRVGWVCIVTRVLQSVLLGRLQNAGSLMKVGCLHGKCQVRVGCLHGKSQVRAGCFMVNVGCLRLRVRCFMVKVGCFMGINSANPGFNYCASWYFRSFGLTACGVKRFVTACTCQGLVMACTCQRFVTGCTCQRMAGCRGNSYA